MTSLGVTSGGLAGWDLNKPLLEMSCGRVRVPLIPEGHKVPRVSVVWGVRTDAEEMHVLLRPCPLWSEHGLRPCLHRVFPTSSEDGAEQRSGSKVGRNGNSTLCRRRPSRSFPPGMLLTAEGRPPGARPGLEAHVAEQPCCGCWCFVEASGRKGTEGAGGRV